MATTAWPGGSVTAGPVPGAPGQQVRAAHQRPVERHAASAAHTEPSNRTLHEPGEPGEPGQPGQPGQPSGAWPVLLGATGVTAALTSLLWHAADLV